MSFLLGSFVLLLGCESSHINSKMVSQQDGDGEFFPSVGNATGMAAGTKVEFSADGVSFNMAYVPGGFTFPTGFYDDGAPATVANA